MGAIGLAQEFVAGVALDSYSADKMRRSAVERQLETLGEACVRLAKLESAWMISVANLKLAIDLRNRIIHGHDAVDDEIVFTTVLEELPSLKQELNRLLSERGCVFHDCSTRPSRFTVYGGVALLTGLCLLSQAGSTGRYWKLM